MEISRRKLLSSAAVGIPAITVSGCGLFKQNANGSYGLSAQAIAYIQDAVNLAASYVPSVESIAAIVATFIPGGAAVVQVGSTFINQVIGYLENLVANPPTLGARLGSHAYARFKLATPSATNLVGYTKVGGVPVFSGPHI
jgi:hypothetical protein